MKYIDFEKLIKTKQSNCPCCSSDSTSIIDLPKYPLTEFYKKSDDVRDAFGFIDQSVLFCEACNHLFLSKILDASKIYDSTNYITSSISSQGAVECIDAFVSFIRRTSDKSDVHGSSLIDIGGNDSTLLNNFIDSAGHLINIDPNASKDNENIELRREFLEEVDFSDFHQKTKQIFVSSHTIEHLEDPASLLRKLSKVIKINDILYLQFPSMEKLIEQGRYDQICHQHINLFSLNSISNLMEKEGLYVQDYEFDTSHFGTLRIKLTRAKSVRKQSKTFTESEVVNSYIRFKSYYHALNNSLLNVFNNGQGFGAGLMVPTLAYNLPLINKLSVIIDESPSRTGKKFINLNPPILGIKKLDINSPVLITSISTKAAARKIFSKLVSLGIKDISLPSNIL
jgi:cyclopropane-fatty-acyl-phospholipid synthase